MVEAGSRPASKGLPMVQGSAPPSRSGQASASRSGQLPESPGSRGSRRPTASRTGTSSRDAAMDALTASLIQRMRLKFGEMAQNVKSQEIIAQEVLNFMARFSAGRVKEQDIAVLVEIIRERLAGGTPQPNTRAGEIHAKVEHDEWAKMFEYRIAVGKVTDMAEAAAAKKRQVELRGILHAQMQEREDQKRVEQNAAVDYFHKEQAELKQWASEEERKKALQAEIMAQLKEDRLVQLEERNDRRAKAQAKQQMEDAKAAARIAYETRAEFEREEADRVRAKEQLKDFLMGNERNKVLREEAKQKQWEEDAAFQKAWEAQLDKQERERLSRLETLKKIQNQQAEIAKTRPEAKRWLDPALIDRYYKEREEARAAEEVRRVAVVKQGAAKVVKEVEVQLREREAAKEAARREEEARARELFDKVARDEEAERQRQQAVVAKKLKFKQTLDEQLRENARRRIVAPMSETEKKINSGLLQRVQDWERTGRSLSSSLELSPTTRLSVL